MLVQFSSCLFYIWDQLATHAGTLQLCCRLEDEITRANKRARRLEGLLNDLTCCVITPDEADTTCAEVLGGLGDVWADVSSGSSRDRQIQVRFLDRVSINVFETWRLVRCFETPHGQLRRKHFHFCTACKVLGIGRLFYACKGLQFVFIFASVHLRLWLLNSICGWLLACPRRPLVWVSQAKWPDLKVPEIARVFSEDVLRGPICGRSCSDLA